MLLILKCLYLIVCYFLLHYDNFVSVFVFDP